MPKQGDWSFEIRVRGAALKEHTIESHKVVQAAPGKEFEVFVEYAGFDGLWLIECWVDGKQTNARHFLDPARQTSRGGHRDLTFSSWTKSQDGHQIKHNFLFAGAAKGDDDDEGSSRPSVATWNRAQSCVEIKIYQGAYGVLQSDTHSANRANRSTPFIRSTPRQRLRLSLACAHRCGGPQSACGRRREDHGQERPFGRRRRRQHELRAEHDVARG